VTKKKRKNIIPAASRPSLATPIGNLQALLGRASALGPTGRLLRSRRAAAALLRTHACSIGSGWHRSRSARRLVAAVVKVSFSYYQEKKIFSLAFSLGLSSRE
jgi:hypothetical protein